VNFRENFNTRGAVIGFFISNKCNFTCAHCCTESGPGESDLIPLSLLESFLQSAVLKEGVKAFHASGGEPFLFPQHLEMISQHAAQHGKLFGVNTNAFWGRSKYIKDLLRNERLKGLTNLFISYSKWHAEFIDVNTVREAIECAISTNKTVELMIVYEGEDELGHYTRELTSNHPEMVVMRTHVEYIGRAANLPRADSARQYTEVISGCGEAKRPTLMSNGDFIACCNTVAYKAGADGLMAGSVFEKDSQILLEEYKKNLLFSAIAHVGPNLIAAALRVDSTKNCHTSTDKCETCKGLLGNYDAADIETALKNSGIIKLIDLSR